MPAFDLPSRVRVPLLIPVLDLMHGQVVRGIAGQRESYKALETPLANGSEPLAIAAALRDLVGHPTVYVADLDAIENNRPHWDVLQRLVADGGELIVDAGLRTAERAERLAETGCRAIVAALETLPDPQPLQQIVDAVGADRTLFSLDLQNGRLLGEPGGWDGDQPVAIAQQAVQIGIGGMIVLDLAGVGVGRGVPTLSLCRQLRERFPDLPLMTGGGVRSAADVRQLQEAGVDSVLIASALHEGAIGPEEIETLSDPRQAGGSSS